MRHQGQFRIGGQGVDVLLRHVDLGHAIAEEVDHVGVAMDDEEIEAQVAHRLSRLVFQGQQFLFRLPFGILQPLFHFGHSGFLRASSAWVSRPYPSTRIGPATNRATATTTATRLSRKLSLRKPISAQSMRKVMGDSDREDGGTCSIWGTLANAYHYRRSFAGGKVAGAGRGGMEKSLSILSSNADSSRPEL